MTDLFVVLGMIPVLQGLLEQDPTTEYAYLCDPCVQHVSRLPKEGKIANVCVQMLNLFCMPSISEQQTC
jgi:hypothetical protein